MTNEHTQTLLEYTGMLDFKPISKISDEAIGTILVRIESVETYDVVFHKGKDSGGTHRYILGNVEIDPTLITHFMIVPTSTAGAVIRELVKDLNKIRTDLTTVAAQLVRGDDLPSFHQEDHEIKVPKRMLNKLEVAYEKQVGKGVKVKKSIDDITSSLARAASLIETKE